MIKTNPFPARIKRILFLRTEIERLLLTSVAFGALLLLARVCYTGRLTFAFLVWNLFLAFVPYFLSYTMQIRPGLRTATWKLVAMTGLWLLCIPNSFYMITDLFHLYDSTAVPRWFDLLLIFSFAWNALLMGILSVRQMEKICCAHWPVLAPRMFIYPVMLLNAVGVYIGRYLRFNSWDVLSSPFRLASDILYILLHPFQYKSAWIMVACFSTFLSILYNMLRRLGNAA